METYNIKYLCGCVHEIECGTLEETGGRHNPTGKQEKCSEHKVMCPTANA